MDPNIRPALVGDRDSALSRFERLASLADLVKLSDEDAAFLYPDLTPNEAARKVAALGPIVAVTKGSNGSVLVADAETVEILPVITSVSDTVGAGDSYMSALLWALLDARRTRLRPIAERELAQAGSFAAKAAAITVGRPGAEPPRLCEVEGERLPT
jgi:fructokinase